LKLSIGLVLVGVLAQGASLSAAPLPDAGSITQQLEQKRQRELPIPVFPKQVEEVVELPPLDPDRSVYISKIEFSGQESISLELLEQQFIDAQAQDYDFARMKNLTEEVADFYQDRGLWAKVILPQQTLENGVLKVRIFEGRLGDVVIENTNPGGEPLKLSEQKIREFVVSGQVVGETFNILKFEDAVKNLNAVPGIAGTAVLRAGKEQGETDVFVRASNTPTLAGSLSIDRNGGKATGYNQATLSVSFDGVLGKGDQFTAMLLRSDLLAVTAVGANFPIGSDGTRLGLNYTDIQMDRDPLSNSSLVSINKPFVQSAEMNVTGALSWTRKNTPEEVDADVLALNGVFSWPDQLLGFDVVNSVNLTGTAGWQHKTDALRSNPDIDAKGSLGLYQKVGFNLNQNITVNDKDQMALTLMGQYAFGNLESGEKFGIAGLPAVRAYPGGEASGDHGYFFSAKYQRQFNPLFAGRIFFDHGFVQANQNAWSDDPDNVGSASFTQLSGVGLGATLSYEGMIVNADLSTRLGNNPNPNADGLDSDGTLKEPRLWVSLMVPF